MRRVLCRLRQLQAPQDAWHQTQTQLDPKPRTDHEEEAAPVHLILIEHVEDPVEGVEGGQHARVAQGVETRDREAEDLHTEEREVRSQGWRGQDSRGISCHSHLLHTTI